MTSIYWYFSRLSSVECTENPSGDSASYLAVERNAVRDGVFGVPNRRPGASSGSLAG